MADIPQEFSGDLLNSIRAGLLRVHSKHLDKVGLTECLKESYDVYAGLLQEAGWPLNETLLTESIPALGDTQNRPVGVTSKPAS
jgi:hypothetical protein